ncbi:aspartate/glutamate racemase family protein [Methylobacterium sp. J-072]|uniref:aspartate/glutamate racemase family protein n=1 Tax=Methylobacterium sp. J-072 TaxID=2836651 RepID=UPI0024442ACF|nr:aspartate/glutamate racemase family protein [Methylobacterium sp. J-072]
MTAASRKLGVLGGLSRSSTIGCHDMINREILDLTDNRHAADLVMWSFDPDTIVHLLSENGWSSIAPRIEEAISNLLCEGIDGLMIASDTLHCALEREAIHCGVPVIQLRDVLADEIRRLSLTKIGFVGTSVTMRSPYYRDFIQGSHGIDIVLPSESLWINIDYSICNRIYDGEGTILEAETYTQILSDFEAQNVDGIVVASPEIALAFNKPKPVPVLHTAKLHAAAAARWCVADRDIVQPTLPLYDAMRPAPAESRVEASDAPSRIALKMPYSDTFPYSRKGKGNGKGKAAASAPTSVGKQSPRS